MKNNEETLTEALRYHKMGWQVIPVMFGEKIPVNPGWPSLRLDVYEIEKEFRNNLRNIGVLLGQPSNGLIDIDLDHPIAVALADDFLPGTNAIFGRAGNLRSHRLYNVKQPINNLVLKANKTDKSPIIEIRGTGLQTIFPPSVHTSGERVFWDVFTTPAKVDSIDLLVRVQKLANAVRQELRMQGMLDQLTGSDDT